MDLQLEGKRALVTGSSAGIGWAIACELASEGAYVTLNGRDPARLDAALERLRAQVPGAIVHGVAVDLASAEGCQTLLAAAGEQDILVNNLGIFEPKDFAQITDADWLRFFEVNVLSGVRMARHHLARMQERGWGRVVRAMPGRPWKKRKKIFLNMPALPLCCSDLSSRARWRPWSPTSAAPALPPPMALRCALRAAWCVPLFRFLFTEIS